MKRECPTESVPFVPDKSVSFFFSSDPSRLSLVLSFFERLKSIHKWIENTIEFIIEKISD